MRSCGLEVIFHPRRSNLGRLTIEQSFGDGLSDLWCRIVLSQWRRTLDMLDVLHG